jgi:DNA-binding response OmpR family regulator
VLSPAAESADTTEPSRRVLVVEDDPGVRDVILLALEGEGIPATGVTDGQAALDWIARRRPAAVLLDLGLPLVDGMRVGAELRRTYGDALPIVVITARSGAAESARRLGARDFLVKPFRLDELLAVVRRVLC